MREKKKNYLIYVNEVTFISHLMRKGGCQENQVGLEISALHIKGIMGISDL